MRASPHAVLGEGGGTRAPGCRPALAACARPTPAKGWADYDGGLVRPGRGRGRGSGGRPAAAKNQAKKTGRARAHAHTAMQLPALCPGARPPAATAGALPTQVGVRGTKRAVLWAAPWRAGRRA